MAWDWTQARTYKVKMPAAMMRAMVVADSIRAHRQWAEYVAELLRHHPSEK